ncbi:pyridoxal phosphate-dependent aminotransferase [Clostridium rectalis]|uniref:pyridoxal phosphate-dependent aminotransferase n=1 Tax=Clostridium rectalis TaxID=2040295 RepID=UPI000F62D39D|nr:histidinol-phosphate transaminase [Clostridium rectalis]
MQHGGDIYTDGVLKGKKLIDFSSNINPIGVPKSFKSNIVEAIEVLNRYPDAHYRNLKLYLKNYINNNYNFEKKDINEIICEQDLILGNGAAEIIDLVISCFKKILIITPSFGEYEEDSIKWGLHIEYVSMTEEMEYDYHAILDKLHNVDALLIGNPNNPNGRIVDKKEFKNILEYCEKNKKSVIIDEAFIEFTGDVNNSFVTDISKYKCIFIIRALTKFYAMPGIRMGFGFSKDYELLENIKKKQNPWNINCFAEVAAKYVLTDKKYIRDSIKWIKEERCFLTNQLEKVNYIDRVYKTNSNFILCKLKGIDCHELYNKCLDNGIVIRKCNNYTGLDNSFVRFAIKDREMNKMLINILQSIK